MFFGVIFSDIFNNLQKFFDSSVAFHAICPMRYYRYIPFYFTAQISHDGLSANYTTTLFLVADLPKPLP
jgi:hypothetical protein